MIGRVWRGGGDCFPTKQKPPFFFIFFLFLFPPPPPTDEERLPKMVKLSAEAKALKWLQSGIENHLIIKIPAL